jgi:hypothetical protein
MIKSSTNMPSIGEQLKPNWGPELPENITDEQIRKAGPQRRHGSNSRLLLEVTGMKRLIYISYIQVANWRMEFDQEPGDLGAFFLPQRKGPLVSRVAISDPGLKLYFDRYGKYNREGPEHLASLLLPSDPDLVTGKTIRDNAHFAPEQISLMCEVLTFSNPISESKYQELMTPLYKIDRQTSE